MKSARGHLIRGRSSLSPEASNAAKARASRIWETAIENMIDAADPNVSQRAARERADSGGFMEAEFQYGRVGRKGARNEFSLLRDNRSLTVAAPNGPPTPRTQPPWSRSGSPCARKADRKST